MSGRSLGDHLLILLGATLVIAGAILTLAQLAGVRVIVLGWPVLVMAPGLAMLAAAFSVPAGRGLGYLAIPACVILVAGVVLEVQVFTGDWQSWSYAWALVAPGGVGLGLVLAGMRERSPRARNAGAVLLAAGGTLFIVAEWFFVRIAEVGGPGLGRGFGLVLPALVIALGLVLVARGLTRRR